MEKEDYIKDLFDELELEINSLTSGNVSHKIPSLLMALNAIRKYVEKNMEKKEQ